MRTAMRSSQAMIMHRTARSENPLCLGLTLGVAFSLALGQPALAGTGMGTEQVAAPSAPKTSEFRRTGDPCAQKDGMDRQSLQQMGTYCSAAEAADKAAKNQRILGSLHSAVGAFCLIPCTSQWTGYGAALIPYCSGASVAAGVTDIVVTKQFTGAVGALMGAYGLYQTWGVGAKIAAGNQALTGAYYEGVEGATQGMNVTSKGADKVAEGAHAADQGAIKGGQDAAKSGAKMSCFTAAVETGMSIMSFMGAKSSDKVADENRENAKQLVSQALIAPESAPGSAAPPLSAPATVRAAGAGAGSADGVHEGAGSKSGQLRPLLAGPKPCSGGFSSQLGCLAARGVSLPQAARHPDFVRTLEKMAKMPIDQLLSGGSTGSIIGTAAGSAFGDGAKNAVQSAIAKAENELRQDSAAPVYAAAGGGGGGGSADGDPMAGLGKAFGELMEGLNGKPGEEAVASNQSEEFGRDAAGFQSGAEEDRTVSLFERISRRYVASRDRVAATRYSSPENRSLAR